MKVQEVPEARAEQGGDGAGVAAVPRSACQGQVRRGNDAHRFVQRCTDADNLEACYGATSVSSKH
jgi:hypothetical protein